MSGVKTRLSVMMFLQYTIWGVWAPILAVYMGGLESFREDTGWKINLVYMTMAIASMISPVIAGQLADRYFSTEKYLAFSHLMGGLTLFWAAQITDFQGLFWIMMLHSLFYAPTVSLTNSIAFAHLPDGEKDFGFIRMFGTVGWIVIGALFGVWTQLPVWFPEWSQTLPSIPDTGDCLYVGAVLSVIMAAFCLTLPHTPPSEKKERPFAFLEAFRLCKDRSFAVLIAVAFLVSTELQFYYVLTPNFFNDEPGPSLTQSQLIEAAELEGEDATDNATILMRFLDVNRNRKLSEQELANASQRRTELDAVYLGVVGAGEPADLEKLREIITEADLATEGERSVDDIAGYVQKAVEDENADKKVSEEELDKFIDEVRPVQPRVGPALESFDEIATNKGGLNLNAGQTQWVMLLGQLMEILVLLMLPWALARLGFGVTIGIGIAAWAVRYAVFALGDPRWLVIASQTLHGFGFGFFFVGAMIYADRIAPKDIRASAQGLIIFITYGAGMVISSLIAGPVADYFDFDWHKIFLVPVAITTLCTLLFLIGFRETAKPVAPEETTPGEQREGPEVA